MSVVDVVRFAAGALRGHGLRTSLSLVGVAIGVVAVILLTSLGEGARQYVVGEFASLGTNLLIVLPGKTETTGFAPIVGGVPNDLTLEDAEAVARQLGQVRRLAPLTVGSAVVKHGQRSREVTIIGTTAEMMDIREMSMQIGRYLPAGDPHQAPRVAVIGSKVQAEIFPNRNPLGEIIRIGDERFRVIGVTRPRGVSVGMDFDDVVQVPVWLGMKLFNRTGLFRLFVEVRSFQEIDSAARAVRDVLTERHREEDVTILTQDSVVSTFGRILTALTATLAGIAAISLSVAGIGIMNVMLVSVSERTREIGLLKALGATPGQILGVFLAEAAMLSTLGGLTGLAIGLGLARLFSAIYPAFPIEPPVWAWTSALAVSLLVGMLFGAMPARRAARLEPVAALARR